MVWRYNVLQWIPVFSVTWTRVPSVIIVAEVADADIFAGIFPYLAVMLLKFFHVQIGCNNDTKRRKRHKIRAMNSGWYLWSTLDHSFSPRTDDSILFYFYMKKNKHPVALFLFVFIRRLPPSSCTHTHGNLLWAHFLFSSCNLCRVYKQPNVAEMLKIVIKSQTRHSMGLFREKLVYYVIQYKLYDKLRSKKKKTHSHTHAHMIGR